MIPFFSEVRGWFFLSYVITQGISNSKFIVMKISVGCRVWPWLRLFCCNIEHLLNIDDPAHPLTISLLSKYIPTYFYLIKLFMPSKRNFNIHISLCNMTLQKKTLLINMGVIYVIHLSSYIKLMQCMEWRQAELEIQK